jgi:hypothetical protein
MTKNLTKTETNQFNENDDIKIYNFNDYEIIDVDLIDDELLCQQLNFKYNIEYK